MSSMRSLIDQLADSETALICNALDALHLSYAHTYYMDGGIRCLTPELPPLTGEAVTIKLDCSSPGKEHDLDTYWTMLQEAEKNPAPRVVVVQTIGDPLRACVMGDGMAKTMKSVGIVGLVTDGGARDIRGVVDQGFVMFGNGPVIQHTALRWSAYGDPVTVGGITVETGDLIHGDDGGCIKIPPENFPYIVDACRFVSDYEKAAHVVYRLSDLTLKEKLSRRTEYQDELKAKIAGLLG